MIVTPFLGGGNPNWPGGVFVYAFSNGTTPTISAGGLTASGGGGVTASVWGDRLSNPEAPEIYEITVNSLGGGATVTVGLSVGYPNAVQLEYRNTGNINGVAGFAAWSNGGVIGIKLHNDVVSYYYDGTPQTSGSLVAAGSPRVFGATFVGATSSLTLKTQPPFTYPYP